MRLIPASLFGRLTAILIVGLLAAQLASLWLHLDERAAMLAQGHTHLADLPSRFGIHLALTLAAVIAVSLLAVRLVTRPFKNLADAADAIGRDLDAPPLPESGPEETRRAAEAFNRMQQRLQRLIAERSRALAAVSHDLRTPLTRLRLRAELVADEALREQIVTDIGDMQAMLDATLNYLRDLRESEVRCAIDMNALVRSLAADAELAGPPLRVEGQANGPYRGRLMALKRALGNLLDNAQKYGGNIVVSIADSATELHVTVCDDGPGIPEADLDRVAEPWVRVEGSRSRETGGVGLGLAIVRDIALQHGGELRLANRPEGGLSATLVLPRTADEVAYRHG